ncbi:DUF4328 domain-containing protein [Hymenobacter sp. J193]|uniref:DUF4328 domain-containing protein n=1 Tax=Hymenobacter sp. J193 TaxID=2898429 RepID=UPI002150D84F|nr:DUF4328 domain-containing protein [Hymenobacter sp. J193]MCR5889653.1 DUF4328 domain-containing protein [Hymenobacter sp. J193]
MLRDNSKRARQTIVMFWAIILVLVLALLHDMLTLLFSGTANALISDFLAISLLFVGVAQVLTVILGTVYFLQWFRRAYLNLRLAGQYTELTDGWAVGAWFVPFLNLVRPYSIMKEVWHGTLEMAGRSRPHTVVGWWWVLYLLYTILTRTSQRYALRASTPSDEENALIFDIIACVFAIISAVLTIQVVQSVSDAEQEAAARLQVDTLGGPVPEPDDLLLGEQESYA